MPFHVISFALRSSTPLYLLIPLLIVFAVGTFLSLYRLRRGGPGLEVGWIPRCLRGRVNAFSKKHGWQLPYDESGNRNPDRSRL